MIKSKSFSFRLLGARMSFITQIPSIAALNVTSNDLMQGKKELVIIHNDQRYMLRITRNGKLILTK